ncbi:MAG: hypothetical protein QM817_20480 [Archangium sp.]
MTSEPVNDEELFMLLEGELPAERAGQLEAWLTSDQGRARVAESKHFMAGLSAKPEVDLVSEVERRITRRRRTRALGWTLGVVTVAASLALFLTWRPPAETRIKGGSDAPNEWAGIELYRLDAKALPERVDGSLSREDSVLVAYTNGGESPFTHLMVFGVAQNGRVYWYYPAWLDEREDPVSISISPTTTPTELRERIAHDLTPGRLVVTAVFSRGPLRVSEVERLVQETPPGEELPIRETVQQRFELEVR